MGFKQVLALTSECLDLATESHTDTQTQTQTHRHRHTETQTQTHIPLTQHAKESENLN